MAEDNIVQALAQSRILWAEESPDAPSLDTFQKISRQVQPAQIVRISGFDEALVRLGEADISLAVAISSGRFDSAVDFLASARELRPDVPRILLLNEDSPEALSEAVNRAGVYGVISAGGSEVELSALVFESIRLKEKQEDRTSLVRRIKAQNRDLEELTSGQSWFAREPGSFSRPSQRQRVKSRKSVV